MNRIALGYYAATALFFLNVVVAAHAFQIEHWLLMIAAGIAAIPAFLAAKEFNKERGTPVHQHDEVCGTCGGFMNPTGTAKMTNPPLYEYACDYCGQREDRRK